MRISSALAAIAAFASCVAGSEQAGLLRRQEASASTTAAAAASTSPPSVSSPAQSASVIAPTTTAAAAPNSSAAVSNSASTTGASSHSTNHTNPTSIPASLPAGLISLISPTTTSGVTSYYSVGSPLTFVWNYTYLIATPTALDILATANAPGLAIPTPFTLALNTSFTSPQTFIWDTGKYAQETPLPAGTYTLIVYDADAENGRWQLAEAGKLSSWSGFSWGMYNTQKYTPLENAFVCATCNGAGGLKVGKETWMMLIGMAGVVMGWSVLFA